MRLRTRVFLFSFVPFAILLMLGFMTIERQVRATVREGLRTSLRDNNAAVSVAHQRSEVRNRRFLSIAGENAALKAGMQLLREEPGSEAARATVEDQLRELGTHMNFDLLSVTGPDGAPLAGILRKSNEFVPAVIPPVKAGERDLVALGEKTFEVSSVPVDQGEENLGSLQVGEYFDLSEFAVSTVLLRGGKVLESGVRAIPAEEVEAALRGCIDLQDCDVELRGRQYVSFAVQGAVPGSGGEGYRLRSLQDLSAAAGPLLLSLRRLFLAVSGLGLLIALACSVGSAQAVARPMAAMISQLKHAENTGQLSDLSAGNSGIREIRDLVASFNRAATSVREARADLGNAYVEFTGSLASALDARDPYTAGHSRRVSAFSCRIAEALQLEQEHVERIRIGALLHDIGKIGIADHVLQKPGRLTEQEEALVRQHPEIGRRILGGVQGFAPFLDVVQMHHENHDGTGYPEGIRGDCTPIDARIVHVADAFDAMTTDRPYRRGMTRSAATKVLEANAGTQFDPNIVEVFSSLLSERAAETKQSDFVEAPFV